jgi:hypothetical protein
MFWKKENKQTLSKDNHFPHPFRFCNLFISEKYHEFLFVPYGKVDNWAHVEVDNLIIDTWPCKFQDLQSNIEEVLKRYLPKTEYIKGKWPSFEKSKAKSKKSFETDYIRIRLETDLSQSYGDGEVERIKVSAQPSVLDNTFSLVGSTHLLDTQVAQIVIDILEACMKLRS